jgi:hypothetical protein
MDQNQEHLEAIQDIRKMMKNSTRFLSLSGLSGVFSGIYAIGGAVTAYYYLQVKLNLAYMEMARTQRYTYSSVQNELYTFFFIDAFIVLSASLITGFYFSLRKAKKTGQKLIDNTTWRFLSNLLIPLTAGGIFCIILLLRGDIGLIAPAMLMFYGMSLLNASKYTLDEIRYLGIFEIILGLVNSWFMGYGLLCWTIGFGLLHIAYGLVMWYKYERE